MLSMELPGKGKRGRQKRRRGGESRGFQNSWVQLYRVALTPVYVRKPVQIV